MSLNFRIDGWLTLSHYWLTWQRSSSLNFERLSSNKLNIALKLCKSLLKNKSRIIYWLIGSQCRSKTTGCSTKLDRSLLSVHSHPTLVCVDVDVGTTGAHNRQTRPVR